MSKEKILAFLNLDTKQSVDTFSMKLFFGFNISFGIFVLFGGGILKLIDFSWYNILFAVFFLVSNIVFFASIRRVKKVVYEWFYHMVVCCSSVFTLLYGWFIFSNGEMRDYRYPRFDWIYIAVLFAALVLAAYMILKFVWVFRLLKENTVEEAREIVRQKTHWSIPLLIGGSPMILVRTFRGTFESMGLGIGFCMWVLMCIWLFFALVLLPKVLVILKYRVYEWPEVL